jgi:hypothetical protein
MHELAGDALALGTDLHEQLGGGYLALGGRREGCWQMGERTRRLRIQDSGRWPSRADDGLSRAAMSL